MIALIYLTRLYSTKLLHKNQAAAHIFSKFLFSVLSHTLQQAVPQFASLWPERFIYGDALDDGFSVMHRLRLLLFGLFIKSFFLLHGNQSPFTNMNSERHWGIQHLKKIAENFEKCILYRGFRFIFIEATFSMGLRNTVKLWGFSLLAQDSPIVTQNSLS